MRNTMWPLCQFTVSGNIIDLFASIIKIANDSAISHEGLYSGATATMQSPSFLVPELSIAGK